jgi:thiamine-phosphate pyrophosphorylase
MKPAHRLARIAERLRPRNAPRRLPSLLSFTDPTRTPDPCAIARALPRGAGIVYRAFGAADALIVARQLAAICRRRRLVLFIGADARFRATVRATGLHVPERAVRCRREAAILQTAAAHGPRGLAAARRAGCDAAILSPLFQSNSPSAGRALGAWKAGHWARCARLPVYALGGIDAARARRLPRDTFVGLAAIEGITGLIDEARRRSFRT